MGRDPGGSLALAEPGGGDAVESVGVEHQEAGEALQGIPPRLDKRPIAARLFCFRPRAQAWPYQHCVEPLEMGGAQGRLLKHHMGVHHPQELAHLRWQYSPQAAAARGAGSGQGKVTSPPVAGTAGDHQQAAPVVFSGRWIRNRSWGFPIVPLGIACRISRRAPKAQGLVRRKVLQQPPGQP